MKYMFPYCPKCSRKGQIVQFGIRKCLNDECDETIFIRNGPYAYVVRCFHDQFCQKDQAGNPRICVTHCDASWNAYTFNQAEFIRMLHEAQNDGHIIEVQSLSN